MIGSYHVAVSGTDNEARLRDTLTDLDISSQTTVVMTGDGIKNRYLVNIIMDLTDEQLILITLCCELEYIKKIPK